MHSLSANDILRIWEVAQSQHPLDKAMTFLSFACPQMSVNELALLSIGQRDAYLLTLRELTFGSKMDGFAQCPNCGDRLELAFDTSDIQVAKPLPLNIETYTLNTGGIELKFRLPNSQDLAAIVGYKNLKTANSMLMQRCLIEISSEDNSVAYDDLTTTILDELTQQISEYDPQAEILLDLNCPACQHSWQLLFDIVSFFWTELVASSKRLLQEVHTLARYYGWREADILSMSAARRQVYLDLVNA